MCGWTLCLTVESCAVDVPQLVPITPAVLNAEGRGGDASNAKGGEGAKHVRALHTGEVIPTLHANTHAHGMRNKAEI